jgi:chorismate mutase
MGLLNKQRKEIDRIDEEIVDLLAKRLDIVKEIKDIKNKNKLPHLDKDRFQEILDKRKQQAQELGLDLKYIEKIFDLIHEESLKK